MILCVVIMSFQSCKTTKQITKEIVRYDSAAIKESAVLKRMISEQIESFEKEKQQWENTGVIFETTPCPDSTKTVTKIVFDNGKIKSIEGNVRSLNQSLYEKQAEVYDAHSKIDSITTELQKTQTALSKKEVKVIKEIERKMFIPWWLWLAVAGALVMGTFFPKTKRFLQQKLHL